ncbi:hypothetical protein LPJ66_001963 [Kickxella alabastrina]|uniref:Uncharacterized protein n=1 Tax=Kickxella alabastrina TaxID=61397 RepID=A0ACC1IRR6_9FUNG|nr:hypothetical protein LPJ66_001963 [Kickxella alabastrina]
MDGSLVKKEDGLSTTFATIVTRTNSEGQLQEFTMSGQMWDRYMSSIMGKLMALAIVAVLMPLANKARVYYNVQAAIRIVQMLVDICGISELVSNDNDNGTTTASGP